MKRCLFRWRCLVVTVSVLSVAAVSTWTLHGAPATAWVEVRDLTRATPEEDGISSERLARLDAGMQAMVDEGKLAGVVTMLARHGKVVFTDTAGTLDVSKGARVELDSIFRIYTR